MTITGEKFTAKDFRTWAGTIQTALELATLGNFKSETEGKRNVVAAVKATAQRLGNRPATCRNYYVHPAVVESYLGGTLLHTVRPPVSGDAPNDEELHPEEASVLRLIRAHAVTNLKAA
jgi:DNA topoisomerase-1